MIPYLLLLFFVTSIAYVGRRFGDQSVRRLSLLVVGGMLVLFAGLRDRRVGTDTGTYIRHFNASESLEYVFNQQDFSYFLLSWFARGLSESYSGLLVLIALIVVSCYLITMVRVVRRYETAIFLFVALGFYTFFFNGARQGIAAAICFLAIPFLLERRFWPYFIVVLLAATFHKTALVALPLYWIASPHVSWQRMVYLAAATVLTIVFLEVFVGIATSLLSERFATYAERGEGGGKVWVTYLVGQGVLLYFFKNIISDPDGRYGRLLNIYLVGLVPALASTLSGVNPSGVLRLHLYFSSMAILLWPMVFMQLGTNVVRLSLAMSFFFVIMVFFVMTTSTFSGLSPYAINSGVFIW